MTISAWGIHALRETSTRSVLVVALGFSALGAGISVLLLSLSFFQTRSSFECKNELLATRIRCDDLDRSVVVWRAETLERHQQSIHKLDAKMTLFEEELRKTREELATERLFTQKIKTELDRLARSSQVSGAAQATGAAK